MSRVRAFTLIELVIVMLLTSFIVVAGYFAYTSTVQRLSLFESISKGKVDFADLNLLLSKDIQESNFASLTTPRRLTLMRNNSEQVIYSFGLRSVYRKISKQTDTFDVRINKITTQELELNRYYITRLNLMVEFRNKELSLNYFKDYEPSFLMNLAVK